MARGDVAAANSSTNQSVNVGGFYNGKIDTRGDIDWIKVDLVAGQAYTISVAGSGWRGVRDTVLQVFDPTAQSRSDTPIAFNDDVGGGDLSSSVTFTATSTGTYYIDVSAYSQQDRGRYTVNVTEPTNSTEWWTTQEIANYLTQGYWTAAGGTQRSFDVAPGGTISVNITALDSQYQGFARTALQTWSDLTGLQFVETTGAADINFTESQNDGAWSSSQTSNGVILSSTVNVQPNWASDAYTLQTFIHEIGHALGLGHAGPYNGTATYGIDNVYANDSWQATIMSYFSQPENTEVIASMAFLLTPMDADVVAIRDLYGTTGNTRTGDTVYGYNSTEGSIFGSTYLAGLSETPYALTIVDDGGNDTINLSGSSRAANINLNAGQASNTGGLIGNLLIGTGTIIENAIGGSADDVLTGNAADNRLKGNAGNDILDGGDGNDVAVYDSDRANWIATAIDGGVSLSNGSQTDTVRNVETFEFNGVSFTLAELIPPDETSPSLVSTSPADEATSVAVGADLILSFDENIAAGTGTLRIHTADGTVWASYAPDDPAVTISGSQITVNPAADLSNATGYYVTMDAGFVTDAAGNGVAALTGTEALDFVTENAFTYNEIVGRDHRGDRLRGTYDPDHIQGLGRNDRLYGGGSDDWLEGGSGRDKLYGDDGADLLSGGDDYDRFMFNSVRDSTYGNADTILDFSYGDIIDLRRIDADETRGRNQRFDFIGDAEFSGQAGELRYDGSSVFGDVDGDGNADLQIDILGGVSLTSYSFAL